MPLPKILYLGKYYQLRGYGMVEIKIVNVVALAFIGDDLDLQSIALALDNAEYEPEQFPGLIYRIAEPKTATLVFRSGKCVCTGAKSIEAVHEAIELVASHIGNIGIDVIKKPDINVVNIVASSDLKREINLNTIAVTFGLENVEYEPEQFPGLIYRIQDPKVVALLFGSGKIICTGARFIEDVEKAVNKIIEDLSNAEL